MATETRRTILDHAMDLASLEGLEGLTIGGLAKKIGMSKSGVAGHFASKQALQLETVAAARARFEAAVLRGAVAEPGLARLEELVGRWIDYVAGDHFSGGCFFWAASAEFDGRPGAVRDEIAALTREWLFVLRDEARLAQRLGEIESGIEPLQLAFELHAFVQEANWAYQLLEMDDAFERARRAVATRLSTAAT